MIDYENITAAQLSVEHPEHVTWKQIYDDYRLLYRGGREFKVAAGQPSTTMAQGFESTTTYQIFTDLMGSNQRRRRFLRQLEGEPSTKYISRWENSYYLNYIKAMIDYHRHWLFSSQPSIRPKLELEDGQDPADAEVPEQPDWFDSFTRDCTGSGTSFYDLAKEVFADVAVYHRAGWLIGAPDDLSQEVPTLTPYDGLDIIDWQEDAQGKLEWIRLQKKSTRRVFPDDRIQVTIQTYVDRDSWGAWEITPNSKDKTKDARLIGYGEHALGEVPFEWIVLPHAMWPMDTLADWQVDLYNQMSMLRTSQLYSAFLQPFIKSLDPSESATNRIMGEGIILQLRAGDAVSPEGEDFGWKSPDTAPLDFNAKQIAEQVQEGYRIMHQMALAVDAKAVGAIARSGTSKIEDRKATEIILCGYGGYVRDFLTRTLNKISRILGDDTEWVIDGYDNFEVSSLDEELQIAALVNTFDIPSPTFKSEMMKMIATGRVLGHVDETLKAKIRREIQDAIELRAEQETMGNAQIDPATGQPMTETEDNGIVSEDSPSPFEAIGKAPKSTSD
jgi:hypothetical protein